MSKFESFKNLLPQDPESIKKRRDRILIPLGAIAATVAFGLAAGKGLDTIRSENIGQTVVIVEGGDSASDPVRRAIEDLRENNPDFNPSEKAIIGAGDSLDNGVGPRLQPGDVVAVTGHDANVDKLDDVTAEIIPKYPGE
jgi:hypothetical protein